jgi:membrane protein implicated in regulation of membrane protease activity
MILDRLFELLSSTFSLPARLATILVAASMFISGSTFLVIAALLVVHATSIGAAAVLSFLLLVLSAVSYWFLYRAVRDLHSNGRGA